MATRDTKSLDTGASLRGATSEQKLFDRYTLKRVLGRGGMGIVWLAHDDELERNVAMKFLPDMIVRDREAVEDLKRETRRSLDLTHHHIVRIYDFTQDEECAAIIMEYVDGESLSAMKIQQEGGCFSVSTIQSWVSHFCQAMDYAHRQARVVHRDLKPANLMVNGRGDLKVTDFGISRSMSDSMTRVSMSNSAGTLAYMSPEQALGSPPAIADDIYAFGATVFDMLTGRPPFFRGNLQVQLETVLPPPMETRRAELGNTGEAIPALWEEVIAACLSKRPHDRPQGMMEIASLLGVGSSTAAAFRPGTGRGTGAASGPGTSPTAHAKTATHHTSTAAETPTAKPGTVPGVPATSQPGGSNRALKPTRREDVLFDFPSRISAPPATAHPSVEPPPPADHATPSIPAPEPISVAEAEPIPDSVAIEAPVPTSYIIPPTPVTEPPPPPDHALPPTPIAEPPAVAEAEPDSVALEMPPEILQAVIAHESIVAKEPDPIPEMPTAVGVPVARAIPPAPKRVQPALVPAPEPSFSSQTKIGHAIGSGAVKKSSYTGLILAGVGAIILVALLGLWAGHSGSAPAPNPRQTEIASHLTAANTALATGDLTAAAREIAAVQSLDPTNAKLGALQSSLQQKATEKAQHLAAEKAAKDKQAAEQQAREQAEKERLAKAEQDKAHAAELAAQQQQQFDAALAKTNDAIDRRDPTEARQDLNVAQQIRPNDAEITPLSTRIAALEDELKPKSAEATPEPPDKPVVADEPDKPRHKVAEKEPVAKAKPKPKHEADPEPAHPVAQRPPPPVIHPTAPVAPPKRPSNPFAGGAPGG